MCYFKEIGAHPLPSYTGCHLYPLFRNGSTTAQEGTQKSDETLKMVIPIFDPSVPMACFLFYQKSQNAKVWPLVLTFIHLNEHVHGSSSHDDVSRQHKATLLMSKCYYAAHHQITNMLISMLSINQSFSSSSLSPHSNMSTLIAHSYVYTYCSQQTSCCTQAQLSISTTCLLIRQANFIANGFVLNMSHSDHTSTHAWSYSL